MKRLALVLLAVSLLCVGPAVAGQRPAMLGPSGLRARAQPAASPDPEEEGEDVKARESWFYHQRAFPRQRIPAGAYLRARRQADQLPSFPLPRLRAAGASFSWTSIGPHPIDVPGKPDNAGRVTALAVQSPQNIFLGAANGGVWKSTSGGGGWAPIFDSQETQAIGAIATDPNNPNTIYVGTGEGNFSHDSYFGAGLFRSINGGVTWDKLGDAIFDGCSISRVVVRPGNSSWIGVAVVGTGVPGPSSCNKARQGIYLSKDAGATFTLVAPVGVFLPAGATDLVIMPNNPLVWLAGTENGAVWRSTDSGQHWGPVLIITGQLTAGRVAIAVSPSNPQMVLAAVVRGDGAMVQLKQSFDGGVHWPSELPTDPLLCGNGGPLEGICWYALALAFDPATPRVFYLGGVRLYRYERTAGGWTVTQVAGDSHADVHALEFDSSGLLWIGNDGGVDTWSQQSQKVVSRSTDLAITEFEPGISGTLGELIGGTQDNGTLRYTGNPRWTRILGGDGGYSAVDTSASYIMATQQKFVVQRSTNNAASWANVTPKWNSDPKIKDRSLFYAPLLQEPGDPFNLYAGSRRLWRTTTRGDSWKATSMLFPSEISAIGSGTSTATALNTTAYAGLSNGGIQVSTNIDAASPTWTAGVGPPVSTVTDFWVNPTDSREAFATFSGFGPTHLVHTTDGVNWKNATGDLPNAPTNAVVVDTSGAFPIIYVGTDVGVFASGDSGQTWVKASTNLPPTAVVDLLIDSATGSLVAATHGRGAYTAKLSQAPPFARLTTPAAITDPVVARFNVPVQNITPDDFVLRLDGPVANLSGTLSCQDATGSATDCATGNVLQAQLRPSNPLVPGEHYITWVNPPSAPTLIRDTFNTEVLATSRAFRASVNEEETSAAARYTWQPVKSVSALGGSYTQHHLRKANASFNFTGTSVTWITITGPDQGIADVFVDTALVATFDQFTAAPTFNVRRAVTGLAAGDHVIRVEPRGQANPAATDSFVAIDGFQLGDGSPVDDRVAVYKWQPVSVGDATPVHLVRSDLANTRATFTFRGTGVSWRTVTGPNEGQARVFIDGVDKGLVDNFSATPTTNVMRDFLGLPDAVHTISIQVLGQKQSASNNTLVSVEGWQVS